MSKRPFVLFALLALLLWISTLSVASATTIPASKNSYTQHLPHPASSSSSDVRTNEVWWCRLVTAQDINIYTSSVSTVVTGAHLFHNQKFATTGIANNRYHLYDPIHNSWYGWVTADPQWTDFAGYYCSGYWYP